MSDKAGAEETREETRTLRLAGDVRFQQYDDVVYLRAMDARKDYLLNAVAGDTLRCLAGGTAHTRQDVLAALLERYEVPDEAAFRRGVGGFLDLMQRERILVSNDAGNGECPSRSVQEEAIRACIRERKLFSAALELTYRCNERCVHCYVDGPGNRTDAGELTLDEYKNLLDQLRELGCISLLLTGGEVCVKDTFLPIVRYAASLGMLVDIFTNGLDSHRSCLMLCGPCGPTASPTACTAAPPRSTMPSLRWRAPSSTPSAQP